jgi:hypothetical protein
VKGAIGFSASKSWVSKVIRWFTRSDWSHTFIVIGEIEGVVLISEADWRGVQVARLDKYVGKCKVQIWEPPYGVATQQMVADAVRESLRRIESRYGFLQLVGFIPVILARRFLGMKIPNPAKGGTICSEHCLRHLRILHPMGPWASMNRDAASPEDIHAPLESLKFILVGQSW